MMVKRFLDKGQTIYEFGEEFLVHCPRCDDRAKVVRLDPAEASGFPVPGGWVGLNGPRRLACSHCGYAQDWQKGEMRVGGPYDWYFHQPVWLQMPCCGELLWAYNAAHLDYLEDFVQAPLRESSRSPHSRMNLSEYRNDSLISRLPAWIKSAKNRDDVLKCIGKLRRMLDEPR